MTTILIEDLFFVEVTVHVFLMLIISIFYICRSQQWQQVGRCEREKMGLIVRDVGEFW